MLVVTIPILWWVYPPKKKQINVVLDEEVPLTSGGKRALAVVGITLLLWLFGPMLGKLLQLYHLSCLVLRQSLFSLWCY
jgi:hypothetical protein